MYKKLTYKKLNYKKWTYKEWTYKKITDPTVYSLKSAPARDSTCNDTIGPSQATPSLLNANRCSVILTHRHVWGGAVTNTGYMMDDMPTSFGHCADANPLSQTRICGREAIYIYIPMTKHVTNWHYRLCHHAVPPYFAPTFVPYDFGVRVSLQHSNALVCGLRASGTTGQ